MHSHFPPPKKKKEQNKINLTSVKHPQSTAEETTSGNYCLLYPAHTDGP